MLKPFFSYYGAKHRIAGLYPRPTYDTIIEPFAGSAAYACRYPDRQVILVEKYQPVAAVWEYLLTATPADILALPVCGADCRTYDIPPGAQNLIGFWYATGRREPANTPGRYAKSKPSTYWNVTIRGRIAGQVERIKHWRLLCGDYTSAPDVPATWFVDPPYANSAGACYPAAVRDFAHLADWCRSRAGQVVVCEGGRASWLPFVKLADCRNFADRGRAELIYTQGV